MNTTHDVGAGEDNEEQPELTQNGAVSIAPIARSKEVPRENQDVPGTLAPALPLGPTDAWAPRLGVRSGTGRNGLDQRDRRAGRPQDALYRLCPAQLLCGQAVAGDPVSARIRRGREGRSA